MPIKRKYTCGDIIPSGCVLYTGDFPNFINESSLECDLNLDEILKEYGNKIDTLFSGNDLTTLTKECFDFNPATITPKALHQLEISKICALGDQINDLQNLLTNLNVGEQLVTIDLGCLTPQANPCAQGTNTYTILSILQVMKNEICTIKSFLNL